MSGLTAAQICLRAAQIAKGPGFLSQAGQSLNMILEDLVLNRNLKVNRVTQSITLPANTFGPVALESDYLRTYDFFYPMPTSGSPGSQTGITIFLVPITMEQFDAEFKSPSVANYPYEFATDLSQEAQTLSGAAGYVYVYPQSSGVITLTHRYMIKRASISTPETSSTVPWFAFQNYLITRVAAEVMQDTGDDRRPQFLKEAEEMLQPYLIMEGDEQSAVHEVKLDPRRFKFRGALKPVKTYPF